MSLIQTLFIVNLSIAIVLVSEFQSYRSANAQEVHEEQLVDKSAINRLLVINAADKISSDKLTRFNRSIAAFNLNVEYILPNESAAETEWNRFQSLSESLEGHKDEKDLIVMLITNPDVIINGYENEILNTFNRLSAKSGAKLVLSADRYCWPKPELAKNHPVSTEGRGEQYLSSQVMIGFASTIGELFRNLKLRRANLRHQGFDLQAETTDIYLNDFLRKDLGLAIDHKSELIQNLDALKPYADDEIELEYEKTPVRVRNIQYDTRPTVLHTRGRGRIALNSLGNYLGQAWTLDGGCKYCNSSKISLSGIRDADLPRILIGIFIEEATPFMDNFYESLRQLKYPRKQVHLFIHNKIDHHSAGLNEFLQKYGAEYASHELRDSSRGDSARLEEWEARNYALQKCRRLSCDYYLALDSTARLDREEALRELIETNRTIVAPLLSRTRKLWSNFWGSISEDGYYKRSPDYVDLVSRERLGVWNVPLVMDCYLVEGKFLRHWLENDATVQDRLRRATAANGENTGSAATQATQRKKSMLRLTYHDANYPQVKPSLIFSRNLRESDQVEMLQFVTNEQEFGHLVDASSYNLSRMHPDFYELEANMMDWQQVYLHDEYFDLFDERDEDEGNPDRIRLEAPCPDVYWFPLVNDRFCDHLIEIMESFGQWSAGKNDDPRIEGGYESVPTRDIHFRQVGLHQMWLYFLRQFVMPIQMKEYVGYEHDPPRTDLAFVVRYNPSEQPSLRPHHDSSTYTINIALNTPGKDYEGGGCRFVRYNCSVTESRRGWALIHPGRLTHYHEGLPVTKGTRYIMVTFVDP